MSINQAIRQAGRESSLYRQGGGWIVSVYDDSVGCHRADGEQPYPRAAYNLRGLRITRAIALAGGDPGNWADCHQCGDWREVARLFFDINKGAKA